MKQLLLNAKAILFGDATNMYIKQKSQNVVQSIIVHQRSCKAHCWRAIEMDNCSCNFEWQFKGQFITHKTTGDLLANEMPAVYKGDLSS